MSNQYNEQSNNSCVPTCIAEHTPQLDIRAVSTPSSTAHHLSPFTPSPPDYPDLQGSFVTSPQARLFDPQSPLPPIPLFPAYLMTPGSSGASTSSSPEGTNSSIPASSPRRNRLQSSAPYTPPSSSSRRSGPRWARGSNDAVALEAARESVREFVKYNPQAVEPVIGDPAATALVGSVPEGVPGKTVYSAFFSSQTGKSPFTCYECGRVEKRFLRAVRHQRQEHFGHYPFQCESFCSFISPTDVVLQPRRWTSGLVVAQDAQLSCALAFTSISHFLPSVLSATSSSQHPFPSYSFYRAPQFLAAPSSVTPLLLLF